MGGHDDVRHGNEQRQNLVLAHRGGAVLVEPAAFLLVDVQRRGADMAAAQGREQRVAFHERAARGVHEDHARLHLGDCRVVDHVVRLGGQRTVQGNDVRLREQFVERDVVQPRRRIREGVVGEHVHAEALADVAEDAADLACANHTDGLAVEVVAREPDEREVEVARARRGFVDVAVEGHQQGGGVLRYRVGRVGRHAHDRKPLLVGGLEIHVVVARAAHGQNTDAVRDEPLDDLGVDLVVDERARRRTAVQERQGGRTQACLEIAQFVASAVQRVERLAVVGLCIKKSDFLHVSSFP